MNRDLQQRWGMAAFGAVAGLVLWALGRAIELDQLTGRPALFAFPLAFGFFAATLAFVGAMGWRRALGWAVAVAAPCALLLLWVSYRYDNPADLFDNPAPALAALATGLLPLPFVLAAATGPRWNDYPALFEQAWGLVIRLLASMVFVGILWLVIFLSDGLLSLVGIRLVRQVIDQPGVALAISGAAVGLTLAVISDLGHFIGPDLLIRLLRLLSPILLLVTAVFLMALPFKGLSDLFGELSAAAILLAMAAVAAAMVSLTAERDDQHSNTSPMLAFSAKGLSAGVLVLALLALWSVGLRIAAYGLTPPRIFAGLAGLIALGYGLGYVWALGGRPLWEARVRQTNTVMALAMMAVAALSMTPVLNVERLSAASQQQRAIELADRGEVADLAPLLDWGRAGTQALAALEAEAKTRPILAQALQMQDEAGVFGPTPEMREAVKTMLPVQPKSAQAEAQAFVAQMPDSDLMALHQSCQKNLATGGPGCVLIFADIDPGQSGAEAILVQRSPGGYLRVEGYEREAESGGWRWRDVVLQGLTSRDEAEGEQMIAQLQAAMPVLEPVTYQELVLGKARIYLPPAN